ncbi:hypothetical protein G7K_4809-t1 [Saitoella complicata NRRL Y-17804]|uniref:NTF2 domain-containing protein n=2 Tax=Saitoella complicata (strain BCRC 22490 / CBS 7301 / JCM 7358 / NBRC 10748 / NRRL Y-17804) TaxID=698492 RepID=A0A0E9NLC7_SAICN|nr:hypothetical protein G7K_4809-t1 [Saitoella complicata NRRL Y-17804]
MQSVEELYDQYKSKPQASLLADDATLQYITSGVTVTGANAIITRRAKYRDEITVTENVIAKHVASESIVFEVAATITFTNGPGWLVPGIDDNFLFDKTIEIPLVYAVRFEEKKIKSIKYFWDGAAVLKSLDVIGARGRGWPIKDGKDQCTMLSQAAQASKTAIAASERSSSTSAPVRGGQQKLTLFDAQPNEQQYAVQQDRTPRPAAKPTRAPARRLDDILAPPEELSTPKHVTVHHRDFSFEDVRSDNDYNRRDRRHGNLSDEKHWDFGTPDDKVLAEVRSRQVQGARGGMRNISSESPQEENAVGPQIQPQRDIKAHWDFASTGQTPTAQLGEGRESAMAHWSLAEGDEENVSGGLKELELNGRPRPMRDLNAHWESPSVKQVQNVKPERRGLDSHFEFAGGESPKPHQFSRSNRSQMMPSVDLGF